MIRHISIWNAPNIKLVGGAMGPDQAAIFPDLAIPPRILRPQPQPTVIRTGNRHLLPKPLGERPGAVRIDAFRHPFDPLI